MPQRKGGYDCIYECDHHEDELVGIMRHMDETHRPPAHLTPDPTWIAVDWAGNVLGGADDLDGRRQLELDHPGAEVIHDIERRRRANGGKLPRVGHRAQ